MYAYGHAIDGRRESEKIDGVLWGVYFSALRCRAARGRTHRFFRSYRDEVAWLAGCAFLLGALSPFLMSNLVAIGFFVGRVGAAIRPLVIHCARSPRFRGGAVFFSRNGLLYSRFGGTRAKSRRCVD